MTLKEQFDAAKQVVLTQPERVFGDPNFVAVCDYWRGLEVEPNEIGYIRNNGKITRRIFAP